MARKVQIAVIGGSEGAPEILRGASEGGGTVIGILPTTEPEDANQYVTHAIATGIGHARNLAVVASGDAVIAIGGEWGTLSEIAFARRLERPVVALESWPLRSRTGTDIGIVEAVRPEEAVRAAMEAARA